MLFDNKKKIGILGGGQLGLMLLQAAYDFDLQIKILDPAADAPCRFLAQEFVQGSLTDYATVMAFAQDCDIITIEIENVNIDALADLAAIGKAVYPQAHVLRIIQDKRIQKQFYVANNLPTAPFVLTENRDDIKKHLDFLPAVHKLGKEGYDGKGVQIIRTEAEINKGFDKPAVLEKLLDFEKEIAIIIARNAAGEMKVFSTVEMVFHEEANLVEYLFAPAEISENAEKQATAIAKTLAQKLGIVGILAVEMFVMKDGSVLINEVAPRPHNSGHHTMRANDVSQFEQHLRAIMGLPLGDTKAHSKAAMVNILGEQSYEGEARYTYMNDLLQVAGIHPFLYGKRWSKPFRKMGHVTIIDQDFEKLKEKVKFVQAKLK